MDQIKGQAATEFVIQYSWAILIIAVAVGVVYYISMSQQKYANSSTYCYISPEINCYQTSMQMNTTGTLFTTFITNQQDAPIILTSYSTAPTISGTYAPGVCNASVLQPGQTASCTSFSGNFLPSTGSQISPQLSLGYKLCNNYICNPATETQTFTTRGSAVVQAPAIIATTLTRVYYVPITLTNFQASPTGANYQQMLAIPSYKYPISTAWSNVEFTTGPNATGSLLNAWVESNATGTATHTVVWVKVANSIPSGANTIIYMDFMPNFVLSTAGPTGLAPLLTCGNSNPATCRGTYGQYDDGAQVFSFYDNFAGQVPGPNWIYGAGAFANSLVDNGITLYGTGGCDCRISSTSNTFGNSAARDVLEFYGNFTGSLSGGLGQTSLLFFATPGIDGGLYKVGWDAYLGSFVFIAYNGLSQSLNSYTYDNYNHVFGLYYTGTSATTYRDYGSPSTLTTYIPPPPFNVTLRATGPAPNTVNLYVEWVRTRTLLPGGAMPTATFGTVN